MATITPREHIADINGRTIGWIWVGATSADTLVPARITNSNSLTISCDGDMGSPNATVTLTLSNHASDSGFFPASNAVSTSAISMTAVDVGELIAETGVWFLPVITGGTAESIDIAIAGK